MLPSLLAKLDSGRAVTPESLTAEENAVPASAAARDGLASTSAREALGAIAEPKTMTAEELGQWVVVAAVVGLVAWLFIEY